MIVPGGGLSLDGARWVAARSNFLVHVKVAGAPVPGQDAGDAHACARRRRSLKFFTPMPDSPTRERSSAFIAPLRRIKWVVYCKAPFAGPEQVLRYLSRYTHRVRHLEPPPSLQADDDAIAFRWGRNYRTNGPRPLEDDEASPARVHQALPAARATQGLPRIRPTGSLPPPIAPRASRRPAHSSMSPHLPPIPKSSRMLRRIARACCPAHAPAVALA